MASVVIAGDTSGTVTLAAPAVAGTTTLTLPTANGTLITTGSSGQSIPKAALPTGSVLQVVTNSTSSYISSNGSEATVVTQAITPLSASSRILIIASSTFIDNRAGGRDLQVRVKRNSTVLTIDVSGYTYYFYQPNGQTQIPFSGIYYDSPATTSSITYGIFIFGGSLVSMSGCQLTLMEIAA